jgi:hypothetical protein
MMRYFRRVWVLFFMTSLATNLTASPFARMLGGGNDDEIVAVQTISDINRLIGTISLYALLEIDVSTNVILQDKHLLGFANYLDYQWVGAGKVVYVYPGKIATFIAEHINGGGHVEEVSRRVIQEFQMGRFMIEVGGGASSEEGISMKVGTYVVGEVEVHQEPDGHLKTLLELNQAKIFLTGHYDEKGDNINMADVLVEFNPVPEEVIHHIESVVIVPNGVSDTLSHADPPSDAATIPFERLQFSVSNIGNSGVTATFGQIRNPFGIWSDFTSHRNFTSAKNNLLVNGFALKKIELGLQLDRRFGPFSLTAAFVHGRQGRTAPLFRENLEERFDGVFRAGFQHRSLRVGLSGYLAGMSLDRSAFGADVSWQQGRFLVGGELVYQRNSQFGVMMEMDEASTNASSFGAYCEVDFAITPKLHAYGLYDIWSLYLDGNIVNQPVPHLFHGLRYYVLKNVRWTILEHGYLGHENFDKGKLHLSTQVEVTF